MSVYMVAGKPGAGKGCWVIRRIRDLLLNDCRLIVTNFAVKLPELHEYLEQNFPNRPSIDLAARIRFLSDEQLSSFYLYRHGGIEISENDIDKTNRKDTRPPLVFPHAEIVECGGVVYVLDEVQNAYNNRTWQRVGLQCTYYMSQHRKLGDDVFALTQSEANVDKQFKSFAQEHIYLRNTAKERFGLFAGPKRFWWGGYCSPRNNSNTQSAMYTGNFKLEPDGIDRCFDTAKGVGVAGRLADTQESARGFPWWWAIPAAIAVIALASFLMSGTFIGWFTGGKKASAKTVSQPVSRPANLGPSRPVQTLLPDQPVFAPARKHEPLPESEKVWLTAVTKIGSHVKIYLSDGRSYSEDSPALQFVSDGSVVVGGTVYRYNRNPDAVRDLPVGTGRNSAWASR
jgi:hypothetical protein